MLGNERMAACPPGTRGRRSTRHCLFGCIRGLVAAGCFLGAMGFPSSRAIGGMTRGALAMVSLCVAGIRWEGGCCLRHCVMRPSFDLENRLDAPRPLMSREIRYWLGYTKYFFASRHCIRVRELRFESRDRTSGPRRPIVYPSRARRSESRLAWNRPKHMSRMGRRK